MKVWIAISVKEEGIGLPDQCHTSLRQLCSEKGISYSTAVRGKSIFKSKEKHIIIKQIDVIKIKGRDNNGKGGKI